MGSGIMHMLRRMVLLFVALGVLVGLGLGLLVGWVIAPVNWYDTDPSDLRAEHQRELVVMAADSYAVNGDRELARRRLLELTDEDTSWAQVADLVEQVAKQEEASGRAASALRVRRMAEAIELPATAESYVPPKRGITRPPRWVLVLIGLGVFLIACAMIVWVVVHLLRGRSQPRILEEQTITDEESLQEALGIKQTPWEQKAEPAITETLDEEWEEPPIEETPPSVPRHLPAEARPVSAVAPPPKSTTLEKPVSEPEKEEEIESLAAPARRPSVSRGSGDLGTFEAEYRFGDDDFDCSFSIETEEGEFLGECGVGVGDVLEADDTQQVDAFEIWLFDKEDIRTVSKLVLSEYAYQDPEISDKLSSRGELIQAEEGAEIILETLSLRVRATITGFEYLPDELTPHSVFSRLNVTLQVEKPE